MSAVTTPESSAPAPTTPRARYRFGFDIGGTFTDFVLVDGVSGAVRTYKTPTTPRDPARAVVEGWRTLRASSQPPEVDPRVTTGEARVRRRWWRRRR